MRFDSGGEGFRALALDVVELLTVVRVCVPGSLGCLGSDWACDCEVGIYPSGWYQVVLPPQTAILKERQST